MARGIPTTPSPWRATLPTRQAEVVAVKSAVHLVTLSWDQTRGGVSFDPSNCIVRILPTPDMTQQDRELYRAAVLAQGALHVTFAAVASRDRVVTKRASRVMNSTNAPERFNDALLAMLLEARTQDRERLRVTVEGFLGKAGA